MGRLSHHLRSVQRGLQLSLLGGEGGERVQLCACRHVCHGRAVWGSSLASSQPCSQRHWPRTKEPWKQQLAWQRHSLAAHLHQGCRHHHHHSFFCVPPPLHCQLSLCWPGQGGGRALSDTATNALTLRVVCDCGFWLWYGSLIQPSLLPLLPSLPPHHCRQRLMRVGSTSRDVS